MGPIEREFDPTEFSAEFVAVGQEEALSSILDRVAEVLRRTPNVVLIIPRGSQAFHTTQDFLALGKLQWTNEVRVAVASPDPTIAGLARVLGFHIVDAPIGHPSISGDPSFDQSDAPGDNIEQPTAPLPLGGKPEWVISPAVPVFTTSASSLTTSTWLNMPGDTPQRGHGSAQSPTRSGMPPPRSKPRQTGLLLPTNISDAPPLVPLVNPEADPKTASGDSKARRALLDAQAYRNGRRWRYNGSVRSMRWGRIMALIAALIVVALIAGSAYAYVYLPEGTISVTPLDKQITSLPVEVVVLTASSTGGSAEAGGVAAGTTDSAATLNGPAIKAVQIEAPLSENATAPATGARQIAKGRGQGSMHFANGVNAAKFVPAGTQFKASNGVVVVTTEGVTVPATNLLGGIVGGADVPIAATVNGPDGNIPAGQLSGTYAGALQYVNAAMTGGSLETVKVVTQGDIDALVASLTSKVQGAVPGTVQLQVQAGYQLIPQTITMTNTTFVTDRKAGEDGEVVTVTVSGTAKAFVYPQDKMEDSISQAVTDWVYSPANMNPDFKPDVDRNSIQHDAVVLGSVDGATGQAVYTTKATTIVKFTLTPDMARKIRDLVKGQDVEKAQQLIQQTYGGYLSAGPIQARVLWFNIGKLPSDPTHIAVQLGSGGDYISPDSGPDAGSATQQPNTDARPSQR